MQLLDLVEPLREIARRPIAHFGAYAASQFGIAWVLVPLAARATGRLMRSSGGYVVANERIVAFLLTPTGAAWLVLSLVAILVGFHVGRAGSVLLAAGAARNGWEATAQLTAATPRLLALAARQIGGGLTVAAPFLAALGVVAWFVLRGIDPYWLVTVRPGRFWIGLAVAMPIALVAGAILVRRAARQNLAFPLALLEDRGARDALREAASLAGEPRLRGVGPTRFGAAMIAVALGGGLAAICHFAAIIVVRALPEGGFAVAVVAAYVLVEAAIVVATGFLVAAGDGVLCAMAYRRVRGRPRPSRSPRPLAAGGRLRLGLGCVAAALVCVAMVAVARGLVGPARGTPMLVVAHRGASGVAPENTLAAVRAAIDAGADGIEIDVQRSADGELFVLHDSDFRRLGNDPRRVRELDSATIRAFDVGSWFGPAFRDERTPTFREVIDVVRPSAVFLNVELKADGNIPELVRAAVETIRSEGMRDRVVITSLDTRALAEVAAVGPELKRGAILSALVGPPDAIDAELLAVRAAIVPDVLARSRRERSLGIHAWTVAPGQPALRMALLGVDGVLTDDPAGVRETMNAFAAKSEAERMLLALRERMLR